MMWICCKCGTEYMPTAVQQKRSSPSKRICKPCDSARQRLHYERRIKQGGRPRMTADKEKDAAYQREWRNRPGVRQRLNALYALRKKRNKVKVYARNALEREVRLGRIKRQPCIKCGLPETHGHHEDYSKPLDVMWLCQKHHVERHKELGSYRSKYDPIIRRLAGRK